MANREVFIWMEYGLSTPRTCPIGWSGSLLKRFVSCPRTISERVMFEALLVKSRIAKAKERIKFIAGNRRKGFNFISFFYDAIAKRAYTLPTNYNCHVMSSVSTDLRGRQANRNVTEPMYHLLRLHLQRERQHQRGLVDW